MTQRNNDTAQQCAMSLTTRFNECELQGTSNALALISLIIFCAPGFLPFTLIPLSNPRLRKSSMQTLSSFSFSTIASVQLAPFFSVRGMNPKNYF